MYNTVYYYENDQLIEITSSKQLVIQKNWSINKIILTDAERKDIKNKLNLKLEDLHKKRSHIQKKIRKTFLKKMYYADNTAKTAIYMKKSRRLTQKSKRINLYITKIEAIIDSIANMHYITEKGKLIGESKYYPAKERNVRNTKRILELQKREQELKKREQVEYISIDHSDYMTMNPKEIFDLGKAKPTIIGRVYSPALIKSLDYA